MIRHIQVRPVAKVFAAVVGVVLMTLLVSCGQDTSPITGKRVIVVGFDGMDPVIAQEFMDAGLLPNFKALAAQGHFQPLATSNPPQSPVAWSDFATGDHAGKHGVYDFLRRNPESYAPAFSISETLPPKTWDIFGLEIPLGDAEIVNRRQGDAFWMSHEENGGRSTVLRVPVTFPPDDVHRMLAGMGVPDLLGTQGTYTLYSTKPMIGAGTSTRTVRLRPYRDGRIETTIDGPPDPFGDGKAPLQTPMLIKPDGDKVTINVAEQSIQLSPGDWSDFVRIMYDIPGPVNAYGLVRFYLIAGYPQPEIYMSPIQIDPENPLVPLSSPDDYAARIVAEQGLYHTIGMPEETWSLNEGHIPDAAFLEMEKTILAEREKMFFDALSKQDSELFIWVFVQTDRVSHMFYRGRDTEHPLHAETDEQGQNAIAWIYGEADRILGQVMEEMRAEDDLIVISDHGFSPFRRAVHLNKWLQSQGLLALKPGQSTSDIGFAGVDWSSTKAYAVGLNSIYLNRAGRESQGIVSDQQAAAIKEQIRDGLLEFVDPANGDAVVRRVFDGDTLYPGNANNDAPDLVVGYQRGYRASWQTTLGSVPTVLVEDNDRKWSGDHCIDPELVPGVLFTSFKPALPTGGIADIARLANDRLQSAVQDTGD